MLSFVVSLHKAFKRRSSCQWFFHMKSLQSLYQYHSSTLQCEWPQDKRFLYLSHIPSWKCIFICHKVYKVSLHLKVFDFTPVCIAWIHRTQKQAVTLGVALLSSWLLWGYCVCTIVMSYNEIQIHKVISQCKKLEKIFIGPRLMLF